LVPVGAISRRLMDNARADPLWGLGIAFIRLYCRLVHRLRVEGMEHVPASLRPGRLIVIVNHTAGVDPILIQAACPFEIRWMMAADMQVSELDLFWRWLNVIRVERYSRDTVSARAALAHLESGGVLGIFPEGAIERPPHAILPFQPGLGFVVARSNAPVLAALIDGTPYAAKAWGSLFRRSRSRVRFFPLIRYETSDASEITRDLRDRYLSWSGWPANDEPPAFRRIAAPARR
jgi:1-acyl-sn-glycerol-3-phosphate acyltransferase